MKTDISLKRLTVLRGADLLPLLGVPAAALVGVESRELPASATRLDTVLRVRSGQGQDHLHIVGKAIYYRSWGCLASRWWGCSGLWIWWEGSA